MPSQISEPLYQLLKRDISERHSEPGILRKLFYEYQNLLKLKVRDFYKLSRDIKKEIEEEIEEKEIEEIEEEIEIGEIEEEIEIGEKKTKRTLIAEVKMKCCKDGEIVYSPKPRTFEVSEEKVFNDTLEEWVNKRGKQLEKRTRELSEDECNGMGTPRLCQFKFIIDSYKEE